MQLYEAISTVLVLLIIFALVGAILLFCVDNDWKKGLSLLAITILMIGAVIPMMMKVSEHDNKQVKLTMQKICKDLGGIAPGTKTINSKNSTELAFVCNKGERRVHIVTK